MTSYTTPALVVIIVPIILKWILQSAKANARIEGDIKWLEYGPTMKWLSLALLAIIIGIAVLGFRMESKDRTAAFLASAFFGVLTLPLLIEFFFVRIGFNDEKIFCFSGWRRRRVIPWSEIESAHFSGPLMWWVITTQTSGKIRVHLYLSGVPDFIEEIRMRKIEFVGKEATRATRDREARREF